MRLLINDMISVIDKSRLGLELRSMDWTLAVGHRLAVRVGTNFNDGYWLPNSSGELILVHSATLRLFLQNPERDITTQGAASPWLTTSGCLLAGMGIFVEPQFGVEAV